MLTQKPRATSILISKAEENQKDVVLGEIVGTIHGCLIEVAEYLSPGDIVITPEGPNVVHDFSGEMNN